MKKFVMCFLMISIGLSLIALPLPAAQEDARQFHPAAKMIEQINNGQDITRPVTRIDVRYQFVNVPGGFRQNIFTLRGDGAVKLSDQWEVALRCDVPTVLGDVPTWDNPGGADQFGLGDILTQVVPVYVITPSLALGAGLQLTWPTATNDQSGTGKCVALPIAGVRFSVPEISNGSFFLPYVRYAFSFAGNSRREDISKLEFGPCFNVMLPEKFFLVLYPNPEIAYDFEQNAWTFPMDFMVGKMFAENIVGSIEFFIPMFEDKDYNRPYNFKTEARMGFFF